MNNKNSNEIIKEINDLKSKNDYRHFSTNELKDLPFYNGVAEFNFKDFLFYMLNIAKDDGVVLKYIWRDEYENMSLNLWYEITRQNGFCLDIGAHTGIYSIIGNLNKESPSIVSLEPHYLNFARLLDNLKINSLSTKNCYMAAASNQNKTVRFEAMHSTYHTSGGKISNKGNLSVNTLMIDNFKFAQKVIAMKIDTEGHEYQVLEGAQKTILDNKPDIIFEISKESLALSINFLKKFGYKFYFIDEKNKKYTQIYEFEEDLIKKEGSNCYATLKELVPSILKQ